MLFPDQIIESGYSIPVKALFRRFPGAPAISSVVKDKDRKPLTKKTSNIIKSVGDIARIPVTKENKGGLSLKWEKPSMQFLTILSIE